MHALLLAAALAVGSGDGRDGATDGRTVDEPPPHTLLREEMTRKEVQALLGKEYYWGDGLGERASSFAPKQDRLGRRFFVRVKWDRAWRLLEWDVSSLEP
jgi:hypothetical protein